MVADANFSISSLDTPPKYQLEDHNISIEPTALQIFRRATTKLNTNFARNSIGLLTFSAALPVVNAQEENSGISSIETLNLLIAGFAFSFAVAGWITAKRSTNVARRSHE